MNISLDFVFPPYILEDPVACSKRCVGPLHNDSVDTINDLVLSRVTGENHTLEGRALLNHELLECDMSDAFATTGCLSTLQHSGVPFHVLKLEVGVCVMLTRNKCGRIGWFDEWGYGYRAYDALHLACMYQP